MKKLLIASALFAAVASTQAGEIIYWEGNDSWNGNIGSTDYMDGQSWSLVPLYGAYGLPGPQDGDRALIGNWGQAGTAATQPILDSVATGVPMELRIGGSDGSLGRLDIIDGGSVTVAELGVSIIDHGAGVLNITNGASMTVTNGLILGTGVSGIINLTGGSFSLNAFALVGDNGVINLSTNATFTLPGDTTGRGYIDYFSSIEGLAGIRESFDSDANLTTIYPSDEVATSPGPVWQDPVTVSDAIVVKEYSDTLAGKAIDEHGDPITFAKVIGPDWLTVSSGGALSGVPPADALGTTNSCTFSVTDGTGFPAETTLTILVVKDPDGEQISICFNFDAAIPFDGATLIGPLNSDSTYWNSSHILGGSYESGAIASGLVDSSGQSTAAGISYSASAVNFVEGQTAHDRDRLQRGFLDDEVGGLSITVSNIPYASYTVYGLVGGDPTGTRDPDYLLWEKPMKSLDFQVNGSWVYGDTSAGSAADVYTTLHASRVGQPAGLGAEWVEIVQGSVTGMYWTAEASGPTLTIQGQAAIDTATRGALSGIIIKEHIAAGPVMDLVSEMSVDGMVLTWTGEAGMPYGVDTNINLVIPDNWGRDATGLMNPTGGVISVTNAIGADETFYRVISE